LKAARLDHEHPSNKEDEVLLCRYPEGGNVIGEKPY
jgi:hypothetical protein